MRMGTGVSFSAAVRGQLHESRGIVLQDSAANSALDDIGCHVLVVADGHGDPSCARSDRGSAFAVRVARERLEQFARSICASPEHHRALLQGRLGLGHLTDIILDDWARLVERDVTGDEPVGLGAPAKEDDPDALKAWREHLYGTTLVAALVMPDVCVVIQLGDGCVALVYEDGTTAEGDQVIVPDELCVGNMTTSLSDKTAREEIRTSVVPYNAGHRAVCVLVGTDGVDKSLPPGGTSELALELVLGRLDAGEYSSETWEQGVRKHLDQLSRAGSRDDISAACFVDLDTAGRVRKALEQRLDQGLMAARLSELLGRLTSMKRKAAYYQSGQARVSEQERKRYLSTYEEMCIEAKDLAEALGKDPEGLGIALPSHEEVGVQHSVASDEASMQEDSLDEVRMPSFMGPSSITPAIEVGESHPAPLPPATSRRTESRTEVERRKGVPTSGSPARGHEARAGASASQAARREGATSSRETARDESPRSASRQQRTSAASSQPTAPRPTPVSAGSSTSSGYAHASSPRQSTAQPSAPVAAAQPQQAMKKGLPPWARIVLPLVGLLVVGVLIGVVLFMRFSANEETKDAPKQELGGMADATATSSDDSLETIVDGVVRAELDHYVLATDQRTLQLAQAEVRVTPLVDACMKGMSFEVEEGADSQENELDLNVTLAYEGPDAGEVLDEAAADTAQAQTILQDVASRPAKARDARSVALTLKKSDGVWHVAAGEEELQAALRALMGLDAAASASSTAPDSGTSGGSGVGTTVDDTSEDDDTNSDDSSDDGGDSGSDYQGDMPYRFDSPTADSWDSNAEGSLIGTAKMLEGEQHE